MPYREQIDKSRIPAHVAIIMDGNGRWAKQRGQARSFGHQAGAETVHIIAEEAAKYGEDESISWDSIPRNKVKESHIK